MIRMQAATDEKMPSDDASTASVCSNDMQKRNAFCIVVILGIIFTRFYQTILFGKTISKLFLIAEWDSLFASFKSGLNLDMDPSLVQQHIPYRFLVAECWHHGIPLWNEFSGFGMPLLADPQAFVFSPIFALFYMFPSMQMWNMVLILELVIGAISTYFLCREFEIGFIAATCGALLFTFCPWMQWQLELLGNGHCLVPFVCLFFVRAAKNKSLWNAVMAGMAAGIDILSAHPEISFVTIMFACFLMCLTAYYNDRATFKLVPIFGRIALAGIIAFGIAAPMLIPFVEYLANGHSYKFGYPAPADIPLHAMLANFVYPFDSIGSLYLGPLSWVGAAVAFCIAWKGNRWSRALTILLVVSILAVGKLFPFSLISGIPPFSAVQAIYYLPEYLLALSLISALGIGFLLDGRLGKIGNRWMAVLVFVVAVVMAPMMFRLGPGASLSIYADPMHGNSHYKWSLWLVNVLCALGVLMGAMSVSYRNSSKRIIWAASAVALGIAPLLFCGLHSLPVRPSFEYPKKLSMQAFLQKNARSISLGNHLLRPNTNIYYQIPMLQVWNPVVPKGFVEFMTACGASADEFSQTFSATIASMLDITGTRTILSQQPPLDEDAITRTIARDNLSLAKGRIEYAHLLCFSDVALFRDSKAGTIFCRFTATPYFPLPENYVLYFDLKDSAGRLATFVEPQIVLGTVANQKITCSIILPKELVQWTLSARLISDRSSHIVPVSSANLGGSLADGSWLLTTSDNSKWITEINNDRFRLISSHGSILEYENRTAFNRYFWADRIKWVASRQEALEYMIRHSGKLREVVVLENSQRTSPGLVGSEANLSLGKLSLKRLENSGSVARVLPEKITVNRFWCPCLDLEVKSLGNALLSMSDLYYPGWRAFIDGRECPIMRADYLFRAVPVAAGTHHLRFEYQPMSFWAGLLCFVITLIGILLFWILGYRNQFRPT